MAGRLRSAGAGSPMHGLSSMDLHIWQLKDSKGVFLGTAQVEGATLKT